MRKFTQRPTMRCIPRVRDGYRTLITIATLYQPTR
jgi:hypothetical protein